MKKYVSHFKVHMVDNKKKKYFINFFIFSAVSKILFCFPVVWGNINKIGIFLNLKRLSLKRFINGRCI